MNKKNINFENKKIKFYFENKKTLEFKSCFDLYPSVNSKNNKKEFENLIKHLIKYDKLKVETYINTYVIYDISDFKEVPPKNGKEVKEKIKRIPIERIQKKINDF